MEKQRWEELERRRAEERRSEKRKSAKKEDAGARKSRNIVFPLICGSGGSSVSDHIWKLRCRKSARRCGAKHISKSKCTKHLTFGTLLEVEMFKKCTQLWREAHFWVKMHKAPHVRATFGRWSVILRGRRKGFSTLPKVSKTWGFCGISKNDGGRGTFEEDLQRWISRGRRSTRAMLIRDFRRSGHWFPESGCVLEHEIFSFGTMILCDRCSTSYDLASLFRGRHTTLDTWAGQIAKRIGTRPSALHSTSYFWKKSRRTASFLMLSTWKIEKVSQKCFVFDVAKLKVEDVLQNCCVFDVVKFKNWGSLAETLRFQACRWTDRQIDNYNYPYTILLLQLLMQIHYATLDYTNYTTLRYTNYI